MADQGRVPAPELNLRPQLNPAPVVNVASVSPVNRQGAGSNLLRIAESLSGLSGVMQDYATTAGRNQKAAKAESDKLFVDQNKWRTAPDIASQPGYDPHSEPQQILVGQATANSLAPQMQEWVKNEWDPEKEPDLYKFLASRLGEMQSKMSPAEQAGFGSTIDTSVRDTLKWWQGIQTDKANVSLKANTFNHFLSLAELHKDLPVDQRVQKMKTEGLDVYRELKFANGKESNDLLMQAIKYYGDNGQTDMVNALAHLQRGAKGEVPPLYNNPDYREAIDAAITNGDKKWTELNNASHQDFIDKQEEVLKSGDMSQLQKLYETHPYTQHLPDGARNTDYLAAREKLKANIVTNTSKAQVDTEESLVIGQVQRNFEAGASGQVYPDKKIVTKDGKEVTIKGSELQQRGTDERVAAKYEAAGNDPKLVAAVDNDVARKAAYTPAKITAWENTNDTALTSINAHALEAGHIPQNVKRAYDLWLNTRDNREVYLAKGGKNAEKLDTLFSSAQVLIEGGQAPEVAMATIARADPSTKLVNDRMADADRANPDLSKERNTFPIQVAKAADTETRILIAGGVDPSAAYKKVNDKYKSRFVEIDSGGDIPSKITYPPGLVNPTGREKFKQGIINILQYNKDAAPTQDRPIDPNSLTVVDNGDGTYSLAEDGLPTSTFLRHRGGDSNQQGVNRFTLEDVNRELQYIEQQDKVKTKKEQVDPMTGSQQPAIISETKKIVDGIGSFFSGDSKPAEAPKGDTSILKGLTDVPEKAYGAQTVDDIRKLSDSQLRNIMSLDKQGKLETKGFVNSKTIKEQYDYRLRKAVHDDLGYTEKGDVEKVNKMAKDRGFKDAIELAAAVNAKADTGYSLDQIQKAMTRWSLSDPVQAVKKLQENKAKPEDYDPNNVDN